MPTNFLATYALTSVEKVKEQGSGIDSSDPTQDETIRFLINSASQRIMTYCDREFKTTVSNPATRTVPIVENGCYTDIDFGRWDAQSVTTVVLDTQLGQTGTTITNTQYQPLPIGQPDGVIRSLRLIYPVSSGYVPDGSHRQAAVTGTWGWPAVPDRVIHATVETVKEWLLRYYQVPGEVSVEIQTQLQLPARVRAVLDEFKDVQVY